MYVNSGVVVLMASHGPHFGPPSSFRRFSSFLTAFFRFLFCFWPLLCRWSGLIVGFVVVLEGEGSGGCGRAAVATVRERGVAIRHPAVSRMQEVGF